MRPRRGHLFPDDIFAKDGIAGMAFGLEARAPYVDQAVMELGIFARAVIMVGHAFTRGELRSQVRAPRSPGFAVVRRGRAAAPRGPQRRQG